MLNCKSSADNRAYVLINTVTGEAANVAKNLRGKPGIALADTINGPYGAVAVVESSNPAAMAKTILIDIRKMSGVKDIIVYMVAPQEGVETPLYGD